MRCLVVLRQPVAVGFDEVIHKAANFVDGQVGTGVGIKKRSLIDVLFLSGQSRIDHKLMDADLAHIEGRQLMRQVTDVAGLNAAGIGKAGDLHAAVIGQIGDQAVVHHIAAEGEVLSGFQCFNDAGCIFVASGMSKIFVMNQLFGLFCPTFSLPNSTTRIFVKGDVVLIN